MTRQPMKDGGMKRQTGLTLRKGSSVWQWHIRAPKDLAGLYKTAWAARLSLETSDLAEANRLAAKHQSTWLNTFAIQRRQLNPQRIESLTPELLRTIQDTIRYQVLHADRELRFDNVKLRELCLALEALAPAPVYLGEPGGLPNYLDPSSDPLTHMVTHMTPQDLSTLPNLILRYSGPNWRERAMLAKLAEMQSIISKGNFAALNGSGGLARAQMFADDTTKRMGFLIDWTLPENRGHLVYILEAATSAWADALKRHSGEHVLTPLKLTAPTIETPKPPAIKRTIMDAFEAWKTNEVKRPPKTVSGVKTAATLFDTLMPGRSLEGLTEEDGHALVTALKHWAKAEGNTQTTASNRLRNIAALLAVAHKKKWCPVNPVAELAIKRSKSERDGWTVIEIPRLFDDPIFHEYAIPPTRKAGQDAAYWVPLLGLYSGARISELCQLLTTDIEEVSGELAFRFNDDEEAGQSLKNDASRRTTPVHSELIRLGFGDYWRAICKARPGPLFPAVPRSGANGAGGQLSQWFGDYKTDKGFPKGKRGFHSFRHTFETRLGKANVSGTITDALAGHAGKGTGREVYAKSIRHDAEELRPYLELLTFPGLSLPRVFDKPVWTVDTRLSTPRAAKTNKTKG